MRLKYIVLVLLIASIANANNLTFNENSYLTNKAHNANYKKVILPGYAFPWTVDSIRTLFSNCGFDPKLHYCLYGVDEGINPFPEYDEIDCTLTQENWDILNSVNDWYNSTYRYMTDATHYGFQEWWCIPTDSIADCEDYALAKQKELWEEYRITSWIVICTHTNGELHAVLLVRTDQGDFILDNATKTIKNVASVYYTWHKVECKNLVWKTITSRVEVDVYTTGLKKFVYGSTTSAPSGWTYYRNRL